MYYWCIWQQCNTVNVCVAFAVYETYVVFSHLFRTSWPYTFNIYIGIVICYQQPIHPSPFRLAASVSWCWSWEKEGRAVEVVPGIGCSSEVFHVHSYQDQFIQPGWAECIYIYPIGLYFGVCITLICLCVPIILCFHGQLSHLPDRFWRWRN